MTENEPLMFAWICIITVLNPLFAPENPWVVSCAVYGDFSKGLKTQVTFYAENDQSLDVSFGIVEVLFCVSNNSSKAFLYL